MILLVLHSLCIILLPNTSVVSVEKHISRAFRKIEKWFSSLDYSSSISGPFVVYTYTGWLCNSKSIILLYYTVTLQYHNIYCVNAVALVDGLFGQRRRRGRTVPLLFGPKRVGGFPTPVQYYRQICTSAGVPKLFFFVSIKKAVTCVIIV